MLGRTLPTSRLDLACSLSWNVIRYSLQKLRLVRWLLKKVFQHRRAAPATTAGFEDEAKASARDAALAYHRLHQLHITGEGWPLLPGWPQGARCRLSTLAGFASSLAHQSPLPTAALEQWDGPSTHNHGHKGGSLL